ncbi:glycosyltransferase family 4 protein [Tundrisphaera sp. TA3]|uniref:glycosyltransferase family 4 protein n=1 Tax=Tundrisphaera sp. TA3 TaxID=3435775 RepID=UPI003EC09B5C
MRRPEASPRMRVLSVLSSSTPACSGVGRLLFELSSRLAERVAFEFAIDDTHPENVAPIQAFGREHGIPVHVGPGLTSSRSLDSFSASLAGLLRRHDWDLVETLGWSNAATHALVLRELGERPMVYTPVYQPTWVGPLPEAVAIQTDSVHRSMANRADAVVCISPWERAVIQSQAPGRNHCHPSALGCDFNVHRAGPLVREPKLLFVGDAADPRKRFDRIVAALPRLLEWRSGIKLVVAGPAGASARDRIPESLRPAVQFLDASGPGDLHRAYAESSGLILLGENEAAGLPILEALATGTPVFAADWGPMRSLFDPYKGVRFCPDDHPEALFPVIAGSLERGAESIRETLKDRDRLRSAFDWDGLAIRKWTAMASAWFTRYYIDHPFRGPAARDKPAVVA